MLLRRILGAMALAVALAFPLAVSAPAQINITNPGANEAALRDALGQLTTLRGARASLTADDTAQDITAADTAVSFDQADYDTDSFWSAGSPTRLTIPAGVGITEVELTGQAHISSGTNDTVRGVSIYHRNSSNTTLAVYGNRFVEGGGAVMVLNASTGPIAVNDGDYFTLMVRQETDNSVTIEGDDAIKTFLSLKVVGMELVN